MEQTTGRQIVSKRDYVKVQGRRMWIGASGGSLLLVAELLCGLILEMVLYAFKNAVSSLSDPDGTGHLSFSLFWSEAGEGTLIVSILLLVLSISFGIVAYYSFREARLRFARVIKIKPGIPLTLANIADLPAPESLVRASEEPIQAQEGVLLRAVTEGQPGHEEQLLRAVEGQ